MFLTVQPIENNMKRIKMAAIGAMLLLGLACSKDKNQVEPTNSDSGSGTPYYPKGTVVKDESATVPGQEIGGAPINNRIGVRDDQNIHPYEYTAKDGVRKGYDIPDPTPNTPPILDPNSPNSDPARIQTKVGNVVTPTPKYTEKTKPIIIKGVRNDETVNPYQNNARTPGR